MATFPKVTRKDGTTAYEPQITRTLPNGKRYTESRIFDKLKPVEAWAKTREAEIDAEIASGRTPKKRSEMRVTLGDAIDKYVDESMR